ncbi:MAG: hypothetical protein U5K31_10595 [Balneolaceae bacterium]|nr:hypothetical protein [Balneolaceae bacterium]
MESSSQHNLSGENLTEALVAFGLATAAAALIKLPELFGLQLGEHEGFYLRNLSLFVLPLLTVYFAWKRLHDTRILPWLAAAFVAAGVFANVYPYVPQGDTTAIVTLHIPVALWLVVGIAYAGGRWSRTEGRMDFIRFSGELVIYYALLALGGGVLTGFMALIFGTIDVDIEHFFESWLLPCGATGAVIFASWLVENRQHVMENLAPLLARIFTPLFSLVLLTFLGTLLWTGRAVDIEREVLIAFDMLLVLVLGLLLYSISARDREAPPGIFDWLQVGLVIAALMADAVALWAIGGRISEWGFTPNRTVTLGLNLILLVNLAWSALLYVHFLRGRGNFAELESWQTRYLTVYAVWAAAMVIAVPPIFGFG